MRLEDVKGVGKVTLDKLNKLNIFSVLDLLNNLPKTYIDLSKPVMLTEVSDGQFCLLKLRVVHVGVNVRTKNKLSFFKAECECVLSKPEDKPNKVVLVWFNQPYMREKLNEGEEYLALGKAKQKGKLMEFANPIFEQASTPKRLFGVLPIYRTKGLISQNTYRDIVADALTKARRFSLITQNVENEFGLFNVNDAYISAHKPKSVDEGVAAQRRIALEDTVEMLAAYRLLVKNTFRGRTNRFANRLVINDFLNSLPYKLTKSQTAALNQIADDLNGDGYMNRIVAGDVGSGKTVVALAAAYYAAKSGYQAAIMAPTEILARQHFATATGLIGGLGLNIAYLSAATVGKERTLVLQKIQSGEADIVIGTHSLIQDAVSFKNLGLIVVDEQHKFGVNQKSLLEQKGLQVDTLTLSATPIPRAMALILYDDLKISTIYKRQGQSDVVTSVISDQKLDDMFKYILNQAALGKQSFIVCPRIFDSEGLDIFSAEQVYEKLNKGIFKGQEVGVMHGKLTADKKNAVMSDFASGKTKILISTTVVEVGIDVPNATIMAVLNADRFGLATLHQLRGRIGRGAIGGFCFLHTAKLEECERLTALKTYNDGFKIAELDFDMRGGGDFLGTRQCGDSFDSKYVVKIDASLIKYAKQIANAVYDEAGFIDSLRYVDLNKYYDTLKDVSIN